MMNLLLRNRQIFTSLLVTGIALLMIALTLSWQPNAQANHGRGNHGNSLLGNRSGGQSLQQRMVKKLAGSYWGTIHDVPIVDASQEEGFRLESYNTLITFHADGTFDLTGVNLLGEIEIFGGQGLFLPSATNVYGTWEATGKDSFEAVGLMVFRRTGLNLPEAQTPTMVLRIHLIGTVDGDIIEVPYKIAAVPCGELTEDGFAFSQFACGDAADDIPAYADVDEAEGMSTGVRINVTR